MIQVICPKATEKKGRSKSKKEIEVSSSKLPWFLALHRVVKTLVL